MVQIEDHPQRYSMANELHARPYPVVSAPGRAAYIAIKPSQDAAGRNRDADREHLIALLDRFGSKHPSSGSTHYFGKIGKHLLKWESHTEFLTYTVFTDTVTDQPFDPSLFAVFPADWLAAAPGVRVSSALIHVEMEENDDTIFEKSANWFVPESLAISRVMDKQLSIAGDFRIDSSGSMRFGVFVHSEASVRLAGRMHERKEPATCYEHVWMWSVQRKIRNCLPPWTSAPICNCACNVPLKVCRWWR